MYCIFKNKTNNFGIFVRQLKRLSVCKISYDVYLDIANKARCPARTLKNAHLNTMKSDNLYHLAISIPDVTNTSSIMNQFGDVKVICMGGTSQRMLEMAEYLRTIIAPNTAERELADLSGPGRRYAMYKVGPVLCCSHGIGMPSISILLHELFKLMHYAGCLDAIFIRVGTCGGLGVSPGTVVLTTDCLNGYLRNEYELAVLGERVVRPAKFNEEVTSVIHRCSKQIDSFETIVGNTLSTNCFYEGQGRLDGAICKYTDEQKLAFLEKCHDAGVRNIEMETLAMSAMCLEVGFKAAAVCVTLIDRLLGDQIDSTIMEVQHFEGRPQIVVGHFIQHYLDLNK